MGITKRLFWGIFLAGVFTYNLSAKAPSYKVDDNFNPALKGNAVYMAVTPKDDVCCLIDNGEVLILDAKGEKVKSFDLEGKGKPTSIAVDDAGKIIVLFTVYEQKEFKYKGRAYKRNVPVSVSFNIYDKDGKKLDGKEIKNAKSALAAQVLGDVLVIADIEKSSLHFVDMKDGTIKKSINRGIRLCCGIFDFCKGPKHTILVANLGAFKVQSFKANGKSGKSFGKRGRKLDDFHGCCNPVSVASLADEAIVTVEKDPTRVKVYDKRGRKAKLIEGIQELVKGCSHIPLAADSKGNIYLASNKRKIIKCVSK